ncbi:hypothetical protein PZN02_004914 [Sinorhizobium garamanticum]|uniref:Uncharacterized protein n=1 Tax=Sinorhizobium garamanticum TaxID=680247 RepID=A0ABY8DFC8_9HYPH|nr:hypothetical protein [Sinorhizobium garamanticum]WEX89614.1 hypothetical protein PZN02_004914 [Sinorhizobium garamanticum]
MIENFARSILAGNAAEREAWLEATTRTQASLDAIWRETQSQG